NSKGCRNDQTASNQGTEKTETENTKDNERVHQRLLSNQSASEGSKPAQSGGFERPAKVWTSVGILAVANCLQMPLLQREPFCTRRNGDKCAHLSVASKSGGAPPHSKTQAKSPRPESRPRFGVRQCSAAFERTIHYCF